MNTKQLYLSAIAAGLLIASPFGVSAQTTGSGKIPDCNFTKDLEIGVVSEEVRCLQKYLNATGYKISDSGVGSPGQETNVFKDGTKAALQKWQRAQGLTSSGFFGPLSRSKYFEKAPMPASSGVTLGLPGGSYGSTTNAGGPRLGGVPQGNLPPNFSSLPPEVQAILLGAGQGRPTQTPGQPTATQQQPTQPQQTQVQPQQSRPIDQLIERMKQARSMIKKATADMNDAEKNDGDIGDAEKIIGDAEKLLVDSMYSLLDGDLTEASQLTADSISTVSKAKKEISSKNEDSGLTKADATLFTNETVVKVRWNSKDYIFTTNKTRKKDIVDAIIDEVDDNSLKTGVIEDKLNIDTEDRDSKLADKKINRKDEAKALLDSVENTLAAAKKKVTDADKDGKTVEKSKDYIRSARDKFDDASDAFDAAEYSDAIDTLDDVKNLAKKAVSAIDK